jgi:large subunit ribosomal protein L7/L12
MRASRSLAARNTTTTLLRQTQYQARRWQSTEAAATAPVSPKIDGIVDQIGKLTLLETADLIKSLKVRSYICS